MTNVQVLKGAPDTGEGREAGWLRCLNCGRTVCGVFGDQTATLADAVLTCPPGAPSALQVSVSVIRCGRCGGRVVFEPRY